MNERNRFERNIFAFLKLISW